MWCILVRRCCARHFKYFLFYRKYMIFITDRENNSGFSSWWIGDPNDRLEDRHKFPSVTTMGNGNAVIDITFGFERKCLMLRTDRGGKLLVFYCDKIRIVPILFEDKHILKARMGLRFQNKSENHTRCVLRIGHGTKRQPQFY